MKSLNSFINFRSSRPNLQSSYISLDRWLTVGSPSGLIVSALIPLIADTLCNKFDKKSNFFIMYLVFYIIYYL